MKSKIIFENAEYTVYKNNDVYRLSYKNERCTSDTYIRKNKNIRSRVTKNKEFISKFINTASEQINWNI